MSEVTLTKKQRNLAAKTIESIYAAYWAKGGLAETTDKATEAREGLSQTLFGLALEADRVGNGKAEATAEVFTALCKAGETHLKETDRKPDQEASRPVAEILPCWPVLKSNLLKGIKAGVRPSGYKSERAFRAETQERAKKATKKGRQNAGEGSAVLTIESAKLTETLKHLIQVCSTLKGEATEMAADILLEVMPRIDALREEPSESVSRKTQKTSERIDEDNPAVAEAI